MDEVLCDFVGGACRIHGWTRAELEAVWAIGTWSIVEPMGLTIDEFWAPIREAGERFWLELHCLPWFQDLMKLVKSLTGNWYIVSSPAWDPSCYSGKAGWLKYMFMDYTFDRFVPTPYKDLLARPGSLLIDDKEEAVSSFIRAGGDGIVFPCRHNSFYKFGDDPVGYVSNQLKERTNALSLSERQRCLPATRYGLQG
jgi:5'(3')-deoxyribonucleotidase